MADTTPISAEDHAIDRYQEWAEAHPATPGPEPADRPGDHADPAWEAGS
jgi:hypothetical protein